MVEVDAELVQGDVGGGHQDLLHEGVAALEDNEIEGFGALLIKIGRHLPVLQHLRPLRSPNPKPNSNSTDSPEGKPRSTERNEGAQDEAFIYCRDGGIPEVAPATEFSSEINFC